MADPQVSNINFDMCLAILQDNLDDSNELTIGNNNSGQIVSVEDALEFPEGLVSVDLAFDASGEPVGRILVQSGNHTSVVNCDSGRVSGGGISIFEVIAKALGKQMKESLGKMQSLAEQIGQVEDAEIAELTAKLTAESQKFQLLSQTFNTVINALGQGLSKTSSMTPK